MRLRWRFRLGAGCHDIFVLMAAVGHDGAVIRRCQGNPDLAAEADSLHPSVLRLIQQTVQGAARHGRWVGVCGGLAGDPFGALLLTGLGVHELSMSPRDIAPVKARLREAHLRALSQLAERALACASVQEVRALETSLPMQGGGEEKAA